jgi:hypothetical protein
MSNQKLTAMYKTIFLFLMLVLYSINGHSQSVFSKQNLEQASREELNAYLKTSKKLKKTGAILSIAGPATVLAGFIVFAATWDEDAFIGYTTGSDVGGWMIVVGTVTTLAGAPTLITGSSRVKRITKIMNKNSVSFEIVPCRFENYFSANYQMGTTLRIKF